MIEFLLSVLGFFIAAAVFVGLTCFYVFNREIKSGWADRKANKK